MLCIAVVIKTKIMQDKQELETKQEPTNDAKTRKVNFKWDDDKVAEVSRLVWQNRSSSEVWTSDLTAELNIVRRYKFDKALSYLKADLIITNVGNDTNKVIVDGEKLNELITYLSNYQAELQSL